MTLCPLCGNKAEQLFTGAICSGRDCPNYDPRVPTDILEEIKNQLEAETLSWGPFYP